MISESSPERSFDGTVLVLSSGEVPETDGTGKDKLTQSIDESIDP